MSVRIEKIKASIMPGIPFSVISHIYGAEWDGTDTTLLTRTDEATSFNDPVPYSPTTHTEDYSSPFDSIMPWAGIEKVSVENVGELVKIPKFWYKTTFEDGKYKFQIADAPVEGFNVAPAFMDRGDGKGERDFVYVGRYQCSYNNYKSVSGDQPQTYRTRAKCRTGIHNLGSNVWQWDYAMLVTIQMLYLVEFANWDSQRTIGYGCLSYGTKCGGTDSMPYHTGTTNATSRGHCQYRYIENLWGNGGTFVDGIYYDNQKNIYIIKNPEDFSDTTGGTIVGKRQMYSAGYIKTYEKSNVEGFDWFYYPSQVVSSEQYVRDYYTFRDKDDVLVVGAWDLSFEAGMFYIGQTTSDFYDSYWNARLMVLP